MSLSVRQGTEQSAKRCESLIGCLAGFLGRRKPAVLALIEHRIDPHNDVIPEDHDCVVEESRADILRHNFLQLVPVGIKDASSVIFA